MTQTTPNAPTLAHNATPDDAPSLLSAVEALFPEDDWERYYAAPLPDRLTIDLTCTREELLALRAAILKAKG